MQGPEGGEAMRLRTVKGDGGGLWWGPPPGYLIACEEPEVSGDEGRRKGYWWMASVGSW